MSTSTRARPLFFPVPGLSPGSPSTSVKRPGKESLRVDVLTPGPELGLVVAVPVLSWHAQTVPHYDYLLRDPRRASILAGGHCIPGQSVLAGSC